MFIARDATFDRITRNKHIKKEVGRLRRRVEQGS